MVTFQIVRQIVDLVGGVSGFRSLKDAYEYLQTKRHKQALRVLGITEPEAADFFGPGGFLKEQSIRKVVDSSDYLRKGEWWQEHGHIRIYENLDLGRTTWFFLYKSARVLRLQRAGELEPETVDRVSEEHYARQYFGGTT
jgi:hypothetical protein